MNEFTTPDEALNEDELDELSAFLSSDDVPESTLSLEGVDGLMCALLIAPQPLPRERWLEIIWGVEEGETVELGPEGPYMIELLQRHWNNIAASFPLFDERSDTDEGYWPLMYLPDDDTPDDATDTDYGRDWAVGFRIGMELHPEFWEGILKNEQLAAGLTPVVLLDMGVSPDEVQKEIDFGTRQELVGALIPVLHAYWALGHGRQGTRH